MIGTIIDFLFPKYCLGCGKYGEDLCDDCLKELPITAQICPVCGKGSPMGWIHEKCKEKRGMDGLIVIYDYQDELVQKVIGEIKFGFNRDLIKRVLKEMRFEMGENFDLIVPVPLYFYRENWRGFNQAEEMAKVVGKQIKLDVVRALKRTRKTKQQSLILDRKERQKNVEGAFEIAEGVDLKGKKILLVDDVFTSGADMRECTKVIKRAGAGIVWGLALAH